MSTEIDVCNQALGKLGLKFIRDTGARGKLLETEDFTEAAQLLKMIYADTRDAVFAEVAWRFAEERVVLEPSENAPAWGESSTVYPIRKGDQVGPDRTGFNLARETQWFSEELELAATAMIIGTSFRLNDLQNRAVLINLEGCLKVYVEPNGIISVFDVGTGVLTESEQVVKVDEQYDMTLTIDGSSEYSIVASERLVAVPSTQIVGDYTPANWTLELGGDTSFRADGFFWNAFKQVVGAPALKAVWPIDEGEGTIAADTIGSDNLAVSTPSGGFVNGGWREMFLLSILRVFRVYSNNYDSSPLDQADWQQEGQNIVADYAGGTLYGLATTQVIDPNDWPRLFLQAVVVRLAAELSMPLTRDATLHQIMWAEYMSKVQIAKSMDGGAGRAEQQTSSKLLGSREGGGGLNGYRW